jgi:HlyD family secretion protein
MKWKWIAMAVAVVAAAGGLWYALRRPPIPVPLHEVGTRSVRAFIDEDAQTRLDDIHVLDMPVTGTLEPITLEEGDDVAEGKVVAQVDPFELRQQVRGLEALIAQARARIEGVDATKPKASEIQAARVRVREQEQSTEAARAALAIAEAEYDKARADFERMQDLYERGVISESRFEDAQTQFARMQAARRRAANALQASREATRIAALTAEKIEESVDDNEYLRGVYEAEIENLETRLDQLRRDLRKAEVTSPVNGVVVTKHVDDRRVLQAGTPLLEVGDLDTIEIECDVLSEEVVEVDVGDPVAIHGKALDGETVMGRVERIYPQGFEKISALGIEQWRVKTIIAFDNSTLGLRPGTSVDVRIITAEHTGVAAVPERATFRHADGWAVFRVVGGEARLTPITLGLQNDEWAEVVEGVQPGDVVVAAPTNDVKHGVPVENVED